MNLRRATEADRRMLAELAAGLQHRPEHHVAYLGLDAETIAAEMVEDVDDWTEASAVAEEDGQLVGWVVGSIDHEMGRVWWFGPFVDTSDAARWRTVADLLDATARAELAPHVDEEEYAFDRRHVIGATWATERGCSADPGSAVLVLDRPLARDGVEADVEIRPATAADAERLAALHDELFPDTHTAGSGLLATPDPRKPRLVAEHDGALVGYVAVERQHDGSGYIDYLGVAPAFRRRRIGEALIRRGVDALAGLGCERFHLTVRESNIGARRLYVGLGFDEERVLRPFRRGFTLP